MSRRAPVCSAVFAPLLSYDDYPALEDVGIIGDGATAALVARDGAVVWLCVPRFDSEPLFCSLLDAQRGGAFRIAPRGLTESLQRYEPDSGVLVTELRSPTGLVRLTDCLTLRTGADLGEDTAAGRGELLGGGLEVQAHRGQGAQRRLGAQGVGLAHELLGQEVQPPAV